MKKTVLVNLKLVCDPPYMVGRWARTLEDKAKYLEEWCSEFEAFMHDHRSQDPVSVSVEREFQEQCSYCGREWEEDEGCPVCCDKAQKEWKEQKSGVVVS